MSIRVFRADGDQRPPPRKGQTAPWLNEAAPRDSRDSRDSRDESAPRRSGPPQGERPPFREQRDRPPFREQRDRPPFQDRGARPSLRDQADRPPFRDRSEPQRDFRSEPRRDGPPRRDFAPRSAPRFDEPRNQDSQGNQGNPASPATLQALAALESTLHREQQEPRRDDSGYRDRPERANFADRREPRFERNDRNDRNNRFERPQRFERPAAPDRFERPTRAASVPQQGFDELAPKIPGAERLNKRMAFLGLASRREADEWIDRGYVKVNGEVARVGQQVVEADQIEIDPVAQEKQAGLVTFIINKPVGYVSAQAEDGHPPAIQLITPESMDTRTDGKKPFRNWHLQRLAPAGRLDIDSTGLLVLTQDGRVARSIIGEDADVEKEYLVRVEYQGAPDMGPRNESDDIQPTDGGESNARAAIKKNVKSVFPPEALEHLRFGMSLDGDELLPAKVSWQNEEQLRFVLREGKKRQIRRMCEMVGLKVVGLKRIRIGSVTLGDLPPGKWRYLMPFEKF